MWIEGVACHIQPVNGKDLCREPLCEEMFCFHIDSKNTSDDKSFFFKVEAANVIVRAC